MTGELHTLVALSCVCVCVRDERERKKEKPLTITHETRWAFTSRNICVYLQYYYIWLIINERIKQCVLAVPAARQHFSRQVVQLFCSKLPTVKSVSNQPALWSLGIINLHSLNRWLLFQKALFPCPYLQGTYANSKLVAIVILPTCLEVPGSNLSCDTDYPELRLSWFSSCGPDRFCNSVSN
jgi:hypothetical protein